MHFLKSSQLASQILCLKNGREFFTAPLGCAAKRPANAYILYCQKHRDQLQRDNPALTNKEITRALAQSWSQLSPSDKMPFIEQAKADLQAFKTANPIYKYTKSTRRKALKSQRSSIFCHQLASIARAQVTAPPPADPSDFLVWLGSHVFVQYLNSNSNLPDALVTELSKGPIMAPPSQKETDNLPG